MHIFIANKQDQNIKILKKNGEYYKLPETRSKYIKIMLIEDLTDIAISKKDEIHNNILEFNKFMRLHSKDAEPDIDIGMKCTEPYMCDFWNYCTQKLPRPNVFDIGGGMHRDKKFQKYKVSIIFY